MQVEATSPQELADVNYWKVVNKAIKKCLVGGSLLPEAIVK